MENLTTQEEEIRPDRLWKIALLRFNMESMPLLLQVDAEQQQLSFTSFLKETTLLCVTMFMEEHKDI